jgi:hypothetical protein
MQIRELVYGAAIGVILDRIVSGGTGFLFPRVRRWGEERMKARAFKKSNRMRKEHEEAYYFLLYPHRMTHYSLNRGIELLRLGLFLLALIMFGLLYGSTPTLPTATMPHAAWWGVATVITAMSIYAFLIYVITQSVNRLHDIYYRVEFWGEYQKKVAAELPDIELKPVPENR